MGNLCSKSSNEPDNFTGQGRTVGASSQNTPSSAPVPKKITSSTPGRSLGGRDGANSPEDAKSAAAKAAEVSHHSKDVEQSLATRRIIAEH